MYKIFTLILVYGVFAIAAFASQGASFNSKDTFINLRQSPNGTIIAKLYKSDFLLTSLIGGTDSTNPHWIQITIGDMQGVLHKRDIVALDEKDYQSYLQTLFLQTLAKLSAPYQEALLADDPSIKTIPKAALESIFTPNADDISERFDSKRRLLNALAKAKYQQALEYAIALGFAHTTELLLKEKSITLELESSQMTQADKDSPSMPLLIYAIQAKHPSPAIITALLNKGAKVNVSYGDTTKESPLTLACQRGLTDIAKLLIQAGAELESSQMTSPLIHAASKHNKELVALLLDSGANIHAKLLESSKPTQLEALDVALMAMQTLQEEDRANAQEVAVLLIDRGADLTRALQSASIGGDIEMITLLLAKDAPINGDPACLQGQNAFACSPLVAAIASNQTQAAKLLIQNGADTAIYDEEGLSLVQHIENLQDLESKTQLLEAIGAMNNAKH
ncbi:ankyrin repeat domain-containing protein [Helicobacter canis]|uniref:Uncharacterized protein n=1 Tax=Helicobacter canis NCTC 12740 TaxID=1357399 RepID=V8CEX4_9HELI|nr:ankyrin repeat domain-containing protein [Helicobacter canis]ETD25555.1 hypothetical protein HMPREF2087_01383 [Helicobacter canis NCTC 12740]